MSWGQTLESVWSSANKSARQRFAKVVSAAKWVEKMEASPAARLAVGVLGTVAKNQLNQRLDGINQALVGLASTTSPFTNQDPTKICIPCLLGDHPFRDMKGVWSAVDKTLKASKVLIKHGDTDRNLWYVLGIFRSGALKTAPFGATFGQIFSGSFKRLLGSVGKTAVLGAVADIGDELLQQSRSGKYDGWKLGAHGITGGAKSAIGGYIGAAAGAAAAAGLGAAIVAGTITAPAWIVPVAAAAVTIGVEYAVGKGLDWLDNKYKITDHVAEGLQKGWKGLKDIGFDMLRKTRRFFGRGGDSG